MSWRDIQGKKIIEVIPIDAAEVVLKLDGGKLARISARAPADTPETAAKLELSVQKEARR
jgi:hypothetical protein